MEQSGSAGGPATPTRRPLGATGFQSVVGKGCQGGGAHRTRDTPTAARAAEEKLDVYVNPLEFEHRIPPLAIGDPAPKLAVDRWLQVVSRAQSFLSPASVASLALEAAERANALTLGSD